MTEGPKNPKSKIQNRRPRTTTKWDQSTLPQTIHRYVGCCIIATMKLMGADATGVGAYRRAGVDIDAGARAVELMRSHVRATFGPQVMADLGHFGGMYRIEGSPDVLVASADGVGTKLK